MMHLWLCTLEPIHLILFFQIILKTPVYCGIQKWSDWSSQIQNRESKQKCTEREYHVQNDADIAHKYVKMFGNTNQFPSFSFCGTHTKPHGVRGFSKHYHMWFDPKLGHDICAICRILCVCAECTSMLEKLCINCLTPKQQLCYWTVTNFSYWSVLVSFNKLNKITLSHKLTTSEYFE